MNYQSAFNYLVDDLEGNSGKPSVYGDTFGINPGNWRLYAKKHSIRNSIPSRLDAFNYYRSEWWDLLQCEKLPDGIDFCLFQWAVNCGPSSAIKDLQLCAGCVADGIIGPNTIKAIHSFDPKKIMSCFLSRQYSAYEKDAKENPDAPLIGWENRVTKVKSIVGLV